MRQLTGWGIRLSVRRFLQLVVAGSCALIVIAAALGSLVVDVGTTLLAPDTTDLAPEAAESLRRSISEGLAVGVILATAYTAALDVARGSFTALRVQVSESSMRGLWAACGVRRLQAVGAERLVGLLVRSCALSACVAGAALELSQSTSSLTWRVLGVGVAIGAAHALSTTGLAILHSRTRQGPPRSLALWSVPVVTACVIGFTVARLASTYQDDSAGAVAQRALTRLDGDALLHAVTLSMIPIVLASAMILAVALLDVRAHPVPPLHLEARRPATRPTPTTWWRLVEGGTGVSQRSATARHVLGACLCVAAALLGWRLAAGGALPGPEAGVRALAIAAVLAATVVSTTSLAIAGQNVTLGQLRFLHEQGVTAAALYRATLAVPLRRAFVLQAGITLISLAAWSTIPWRIVAAIAVLVLADMLVDSYFARPPGSDTIETVDPAATVVSMGVVLVIGVCAWSTGTSGAVAIGALGAIVAVAGPRVFASRLRRAVVVAA